MKLALVYSIALIAGSAQAAIIVSYDSGVTATAGTSGSADPEAQGWISTDGGTQYATGYDSGDGGWRTVDGTSGAPANYNQTISVENQTQMASAAGWRIEWTVSMDRDFIGAAGAFVDDYYASPNNGRQNNVLLLVELASDDVGYNIQHDVNSSNELYFSYGGSTYITDFDSRQP